LNQEIVNVAGHGQDLKEKNLGHEVVKDLDLVKDPGLKDVLAQDLAILELEEYLLVEDLDQVPEVTEKEGHDLHVDVLHQGHADTLHLQLEKEVDLVQTQIIPTIELTQILPTIEFRTDVKNARERLLKDTGDPQEDQGREAEEEGKPADLLFAVIVQKVLQVVRQKENQSLLLNHHHPQN